MFKRILLNAIFCLAFANNNHASQLKMLRLPISKTQAAWGLAGLVGTGFLWYKNFTAPGSRLKKNHDNLDNKYAELNQVRNNVHMLLGTIFDDHIYKDNPFCETLYRKSGSFVAYLYDRINPLRGLVLGIEENLKKSGLYQSNSKISDSLKKMQQHFEDLRFENNEKLKNHKCNDDNGGLCEPLKINAKLIDEELEKVSTDLEDKKKKLNNDSWNLRVSKKWTTCLALCGTALFGATRLFSWYQNR